MTRQEALEILQNHKDHPMAEVRQAMQVVMNGTLVPPGSPQNSQEESNVSWWGRLTSLFTGR